MREEALGDLLPLGSSEQKKGAHSCGFFVYPVLHLLRGSGAPPENRLGEMREDASFPVPGLGGLWDVQQ